MIKLIRSFVALLCIAVALPLEYSHAQLVAIQTAPPNATITVGTITTSRAACASPGDDACVAPLALTFQTGCTSTETSRPFHEILSTWTFGDTGAGNWPRGATLGSKNEDRGPVVSHVYETPGTYTVTNTCGDGESVASVTATVYVTDPDVVFAGTKTRCYVASGSDFTGCPGGATQVSASNDFDAGIGTCVGVSTPRCLFKRGHTFVGSTVAVLNTAGQGIVGAFGSGDAPIVTVAGTSHAALSLGGSSSNWRVMDLDLRGPSSGSSNSDSIGVSASTTVSSLVLRVSATGFATAFSIGVGGNMATDFYLVDSVGGSLVGASQACYGAFMSMSGGGILGNQIDADASSGCNLHGLRFSWFSYAQLAHNDLRRTGGSATFHTLKINARGCSSTQPTQFFNVNDNIVSGGAGNWTADFGPQNNASNECVQNGVVDGNVFRAGSNSNVSLVLSGTDLTARNNLFAMAENTANGRSGINVTRVGIEPAPTAVHLYNNTFASSDATHLFGITLFGDVTASVARNNLCYFPNSTTSFGAPLCVSDSGTGNTVSANSTSGTGGQVVTQNPGFAATPPETGTQAKSSASGHATAVDVPNFVDFFGVSNIGSRVLGCCKP